MAQSPMATGTTRGIVPNPHRGSNWPAHTSFILALLSVATVPIFIVAALNAGFDNGSLEVPVWIVIGTVVVGIIAIATGIWGVIRPNRYPARNLPKGLAIAGIVLSTLAILVNVALLILFFVLYVTSIFIPHGS
ncbi:MAG: hypothetical protein ACLQUY_03560 [Ktedonobacterales bacterium]